MKTKGLIFVSCLAAGALMASPALSKPATKSVRHDSRSPRMATRTTQVAPGYRYHQGTTSQMGTRYYSGTRYTTAPYSGRGYYSGAPVYRGNTYYGGNGYYYGGSYPYYSYYSGWPYSGWGFGTSWGYPYSYWGGYPYGSYNNYYSYHTPYGYGGYGSTVAAVQQRLGRLGYYHGAVDGIAGPRTRSAIAAFESRNGLIVDGRISRPLLDRLGLA